MTKKPNLAFRKPPTVNPEQFVYGEPEGQTAKRPGAQAPKRADDEGRRKTITREDGRELRRLCLYFPADIARKLATHCAAEDIEMSRFVVTLVRDKLG